MSFLTNKKTVNGFNFIHVLSPGKKKKKLNAIEKKMDKTRMIWTLKNRISKHCKSVLFCYFSCKKERVKTGSALNQGDRVKSCAPKLQNEVIQKLE
jgi:hypothetical protein